MTYTAKKQEATETAYESYQMLYITDRLQWAVTSMFKEQKENMIKEVKESMMTMLHHTENISKEIEMIKKNQMEILKLKSIKLKWKFH